VGLFTPDEATDYLATSLAAHDRHDDPAALNALATDLGHLPLALSQAAAYLIDTGLSCAAYRSRLADRARSLRDVLPEPDALPDDQTTTVAAAWSLSIDRANRIRPAGLALPMLQLTAMLDANGIPADVLTSEAALRHLGNQVTADQATAALRALHRLSLIDHEPASPNPTVRVHQLIQRTVRESLPTGEHDQIARTAADALVAAWRSTRLDRIPRVEIISYVPDTEYALSDALYANAEALCRQAPDALWQPDAHTVIFDAGTSLGWSGRVVAAATYFRHLADTARRRLGPDHVHTFCARENLAYWKYMARDYASALAVLADVVTDMERTLGPEHPYTLFARDELAYFDEDAPDPNVIISTLDKLLTDKEGTLGPGHPDILRLRLEIACHLGTSSDPSTAVTKLTHLLTDLNRVLGPDHSYTLYARRSIACFRGTCGDPTAAVTELTHLLFDMNRTLGPDHPYTADTRRTFRYWQSQGATPQTPFL
jgi:hypothetical protein